MQSVGQRVIVFDLGASGQHLILEASVVEPLEAHRQLTPQDREAGGQLFAAFSGDSISIKEATGPRRTDHRTRTSYRTDRKAEQQRDSGAPWVWTALRWGLAHTPVPTPVTL
jgi:hypothetical protein